ncbi:MAG TPA: acetyl-CoA carboxylase biotin carboxyl carrier protein [Gemmatimonadales bacterium]|nr:acetyl-CoA carboxylase biotin carboxyl carrier protein [Gemmatimonadales bacterium]
MKPDEMQQLAKLLSNMPGIKSIELKDVKRLADLLRESPEIGSIEVKGFFGTGIVISRTNQSGVALSAPGWATAASPPATPAPSASPAAVAPAASAPSHLKDITSPMVGTFYRAPEPGAEPYVKVGSRVTQGQTVCIIEAMKIMNEIEADIAGVVREVGVDDTQPVEFGQVLFRIDPNG